MKKRCADCKHYEPDRYFHHRNLAAASEEFAFCRAPGAGKRMNYEAQYASVQRQDPWIVAVVLGMCGRPARWFEPKHPDQYPEGEKIQLSSLLFIEPALPAFSLRHSLTSLIEKVVKKRTKCLQ